MPVSNSVPSPRNPAQWRARPTLAGGMSLIGLLSLSTATQLSAAQEVPTALQAFDIPGQSLLAALNEFGSQTGMQVATGAADINALASRGVRGEYTLQQALDILLDGSGLESRIDGEAVIILAQSAQGTRPAPAASGQAAATSAVVESVVVVGEATNAEVTFADLEVFQANDLADIFRRTPSVSVGGGASGISQKIYVRGLEDAMLNVTVDGAPQTSTLFHHIGRVTIDPELLKTVEVQGGAGEATSGAGAIGGSIRFRTKDVNDLLAEDKTIGGRVKAGTFSNNGDQLNASVYGRLGDSWGVLAYFSQIDRDNVEDGDGIEMDGTAAEQTLGFVKIGGDLGEDQSLSLSYEARDEEGSFTRWPNWSPLDGAPLYAGEGERETAVANYRIDRSDALDLELSVYRTESAFQRELFTWRADIASFGFDIRNTSTAGRHSFTYGIDLRDDDSESGTIGTVEYHEEGRVTGLYGQVHSQLNNALMLSYGARFDNYVFDQLIPIGPGTPLASIDDSDVSLNAGFAYDLTEAWTFGLSYAEAVRGVVITDGFTNWGTTVAPGIEPETVSNVEAVLKYNGRNLSAKFAIFNAEIEEVIYDQSSGPVLYENIGSVDTDGYEIDFAYRWNDLEFFAGLATSAAVLRPASGVFSADYGTIDIEAYEYGGLGNNRGDTWNFGIDAAPLQNLRLGWNMSLVEDIDRLEVLQRSVELGWIDQVQLIDKPGYTSHDVYVEWSPIRNLRINLAVINLFDETYLDHSSVGDYTAIPDWETVRGYNEPGRDIRLSATMSF